MNPHPTFSPNSNSNSDFPQLTRSTYPMRCGSTTPSLISNESGDSGGSSSPEPESAHDSELDVGSERSEEGEEEEGGLVHRSGGRRQGEEEGRPRLIRTISLPNPSTPTTLEHPRDLGLHRLDMMIVGKPEVEENEMRGTLMGMTGLHVSTSSSSSLPITHARPYTTNPQNNHHHRRTVSTSHVTPSLNGNTPKIYRFGGKDFVPIRMETFEARDKVRVKVTEVVGGVKDEDYEDREVGDEMNVIHPQPLLPGFPASLDEYKFPPARNQIGRPLASTSNRTDRVRATSPYAHPRPLRQQPTVKQGRSHPAESRMNPSSLLFRRTHQKSNSLGMFHRTATVPASSVSPVSSLGACQMEGQELNRKLILVGPAICRHLQSGGSVRVKDFSGAVVGWMH